MLLACLALVASASAADRVLVANVPRAVTQALRTGAAPSSERVRVGFVLAHPHPDAEDALLRGLFDRSSPSYHHFVTPAQFEEYGRRAREMGFLHVASGPMVRSSYHAEEFDLKPGGFPFLCLARKKDRE